MLDDILQIEATNEFTRSWAERRLRKIAKDAGLPLPTSNVRIGNHRPDAVWAEQRLAVAVDGIGTHGTPVAFAQDRVEINELTAAGWRVMRFTAHQLRDRPTWVAVQLAAALRED
jgi:very-short-patch-repair endonuclease